jgi:hypothetical protein
MAGQKAPRAVFAPQKGAKRRLGARNPGLVVMSRVSGALTGSSEFADDASKGNRRELTDG